MLYCEKLYIYEGFRLSVEQLARVETRPIYPRAGSVQVIDDAVVVRLN